MEDKDRKTIVVIDDSPVNIKYIEISFSDTYNIVPFTSPYDAIDAFTRYQTCDIILLDIEMPGMNGFETIKVLKTLERSKNIPVIFLTGNMRVDSQIEGLSLGAVDYIIKPFIPQIVKTRVEMHIALESSNRELERLVREKTKAIEKLSDVTILAIVSIIGSRDHETLGHIRRTSEYVVMLANELVEMGLHTGELTEKNIYMLRKSAPLHDVGKIGISDSILLKPDKLTDDEFEMMKKHTVIGGEAFAEARNMMNEPSFLDFAGCLAMYHHERWDGSGYPHGLKGDEIPIFARIMALADVYDALISKRPYKKPFSPEEAAGIIEDGRGTHFDPDICDAFLHIKDRFRDIAIQFADDDNNPYIAEAN